MISPARANAAAACTSGWSAKTARCANSRRRSRSRRRKPRRCSTSCARGSKASCSRRRSKGCASPSIASKRPAPNCRCSRATTRTRDRRHRARTLGGGARPAQRAARARRRRQSLRVALSLRAVHRRRDRGGSLRRRGRPRRYRCRRPRRCGSFRRAPSRSSCAAGKPAVVGDPPLAVLDVAGPWRTDERGGRRPRPAAVRRAAARRIRRVARRRRALSRRARSVGRCRPLDDPRNLRLSYDARNPRARRNAWPSPDSTNSTNASPSFTSPALSAAIGYEASGAAPAGNDSVFTLDAIAGVTSVA